MTRRQPDRDDKRVGIVWCPPLESCEPRIGTHSLTYRARTILAAKW